MEQLVLVHIGDEQVRSSVVVVVAYCDAHAVAGSGNTGFVGYIRECEVVVVAEQPILEPWTRFLQRGHIRAVHEVKIGIPIAIEIEYCNSSNHRLGLVFLGCGTAITGESNSGAVRDFVESDGARWRAGYQECDWNALQKTSGKHSIFFRLFRGDRILQT